MGLDLGRRLNAATGATLAGLRVALFATDSPTPRPRWWAPVSVAASTVTMAITAPAFGSEGGLPLPVSLALGLLVGLPVVGIATRPLLAWRLAWVACLVTGLTVDLFPDQPWPWHPVLLFVYLACLWRAVTRSTRAATAWLWMFTMYLIAPFVEPANIAVLVLLVTALVLLADQVRRRREVQRGLAQESERSELEQARRALLEERARIARELHDVVAHSMSLVAVRAETAPYRLTDLAAPVSEEFTGIATAARDALVEMRRLLGVLRDDGPEVELAPQPGLAELPKLVAASREAGVTVEVTLAGTVADVPPGVQLTAFRIVQEALSNASRHAPGAPVQVAVRRAGNAVEITVRNASGVTAPASAGAGLGIRGMRERAKLLGGTLVAAPAEGGGFEVVAHLPVTGDTQPDRTDT